jgi:hypothetical protein
VKLEHVGVPRVENRSFVCGNAIVQEESPIGVIPDSVRSVVLSKEFEIPPDVRGTVGRNITR